MTKRTSGAGRRVFKMTPLHHHFEMVGLERAEDCLSLFDSGDSVCAVESFDFEVAMRYHHEGTKHRDDQPQMHTVHTDQKQCVTLHDRVHLRHRQLLVYVKLALEIAGRKVLVIGAARSGIASARFLTERGATVALNDRKPLNEWSPEALDLKTEGVGLIEGDPPSWLLDQIDLVVVSPGVPTKAIPIRYAERRGVEVIGEIELASRFLRGRIVAITGTNGKTTTTTLIGQMLKDGGLNVQVGGNIGTALISMVESSREDGWNVVELSSFQLETIVDFHPTVAAVLNVTPNHMDRYESLMDYAAAKHRIFTNQTAGDVAILNADDEIVSSWAERTASACRAVQRER